MLQIKLLFILALSRVDIASSGSLLFCVRLGQQMEILYNSLQNKYYVLAASHLTEQFAIISLVSDEVYVDI